MIRLSSVSKYYDNGAVAAVEDVSLEIGPGEAVALRGPSGAGKSTLLNLIGTIDTPTSGTISIDGESLSSLERKHRFRAKKIGFVFQFHHLMPHLTALENVELPMYTERSTRRDRRRRAKSLLAEVGLESMLGKLPGQLSGGERQRIAVARALANSPSIMLADEPTGSLDAETGKCVIELLLNYRNANRATLIVATHNEAVAARMERSVSMEFGLITS